MQHLLGVGHLQRALQLAKTLGQRGFAVLLVSGGMPQKMSRSTGFRVHQLPPVNSADGSFTHLLDDAGQPVDERWRANRKQQLLAAFAEFAPQVLITETFPFGRRMLRFELLPLLEASRDSADCRLVIASIRDILQPKSNPERNRETCDCIEQFYDHVLVHGDPAIARLEASFALAERIRDKLYYSGYVCALAQTPPPAGVGENEVLVSAGGSATGLALLHTAIAARPLSRFANLPWRLLASPLIAETEFAEMQRLGGDSICVERNRADFSELVKRACLSISQAGYNTVTDILNSSTAAVVVPYAEAGEVEQTLRAQALQKHGRVVALAQQELNAASLASAMNAAPDRNKHLQVDLDGAANSAAMIEKWLADPEQRP